MPWLECEQGYIVKTIRSENWIGALVNSKTWLRHTILKTKRNNVKNKNKKIKKTKKNKKNEKNVKTNVEKFNQKNNAKKMLKNKTKQC